MPVYNGEATLDRTVQSVLNQTFKKFEFIIINDGSTDGTSKILSRYAKQGKRIRVIHNKSNLGIVGSLNKGLRTAKADFIARIDCGDVCAPKRLAAQLDYFSKNPTCVLLGTQINRVNKEGKIVGQTTLPENDRGIRDILFCRKGMIPHPSAMYRKISKLYYRENAYPAEDYDLWLRILELGKVGILHERLVDVVNDPASISHKNMVKQIMIMKKICDLLVERIKYGRELHSLPNYRHINHWSWNVATWLYGLKIRRNYYRYHPVNFLLNFAITLLCPATLIPKTPLSKLPKYLYHREFRRFCDRPTNSHTR
jgi:glycosyltransferase involved in cell wall biosynthesis